MFCEQCGAEMEQDARFCAMCGRPPASEGASSSRENMPADHPDRRVRALQIGLGVSLLIMLVLGGILASKPRSDKGAVTHSSDIVTRDPGKSQTAGEVASQLNRSDLSREKAEAAIRKRLEPALSALREGTVVDMQLMESELTTFDPERDMIQASVALDRRWPELRLELARHLKEDVITIAYESKRVVVGIGGIPVRPRSYSYSYRTAVPDAGRAALIRKGYLSTPLGNFSASQASASCRKCHESQSSNTS